MVYLTADPHGDFSYIEEFCGKKPTSVDDVMFILGDMELNLGNSGSDRIKKSILSTLPMTFLCIHGNHEIRPQHIDSYRETSLFGNKAYVEDEFPNIFFLNDGLIYYVGTKSFLVIGGAYSVARKLNDYKNDLFFDDEQPSSETMELVDYLCDSHTVVDYILTHTCPLNCIPYDACTLPIDQSMVDRSTETWMQKVYNRLRFQHWFCGHYHTNRKTDKITFVYKKVIELQLEKI